MKSTEIDILIQLLTNLPGIGPRSARRVILQQIKNKNNQNYTDVLWIGIGGSGLGPLLITESLQKCSKGLNFSYIDNVDPFLISEKLEELSDKLSTTLFVVVILYIWGGNVLQPFSLALIIGVVIGTYSSLFIASPIMFLLDKKFNIDIEKE